MKIDRLLTSTCSRLRMIDCAVTQLEYDCSHVREHMSLCAQNVSAMNVHERADEDNGMCGRQLRLCVYCYI